jgi:UDP-glucose 4-epimerase
MISFRDKTLLITGGTGSFGKAVLDGLLGKKRWGGGLKEIRVFSRDEKKQDEMRKKIGNDLVKFYIGDVRNLRSIGEAMAGVDFVFHAAALKQVPSCEFFPMEAVRTNILGTDNVLSAAINAKVKKVICLSTDKAAYPINAMGMSKALGEKVAMAKSMSERVGETIISCTRYGNVMCSRGSVIPIFVTQAIRGEDLTVTNPEMTRFLMNLNEAVDLVIFAFTHAKRGDLFIQKAPACTMGDLAQAIIKIFNSKSKIKIIGVRHGEKTHETLMTREEAVRAEDMGDYCRVECDNRGLNYEKYLSAGDDKLAGVQSYTSDNTVRLGVEETVKKLLTSDWVKKVIKDGKV